MDIEARIPGSKSYSSVKEELVGFKGESIAAIERFPSVLVQSILEENKHSMRSGLEKIGVDDLHQRLSEAGRIFAEERIGPGRNTPKEYAENVCRISGLPLSDIQRGIKTIRYALENIKEILRAHSPRGKLSVFDKRHYHPLSENGELDSEQGDRRDTSLKVGYVPKGRNIGVVAPGNHPAVITLPLIGYATKYPIAVRPSDREPFTPARLISALLEAGCPRSSLAFLPGDRSLGNKILSESDLGVGFGGEELENAYESNASVKIHGPGNSKIVVGKEWVKQDELYDLLEEAMLRDGGRGCVNMSQIITTGDASVLAERLARRVGDLKICSPLNSEAQVPASVDSTQAKRLNQHIERELQDGRARDVTRSHRKGDRLITRNGVSYLRPTVIRIPGDAILAGEHSLFREYPFQYATVSTVSPEQVLQATSGSLTVSLFTEDSHLQEAVLLDPSIEKVYMNGEATCDMDLREPHEGYITDFLFKKKALRE